MNWTKIHSHFSHKEISKHQSGSTLVEIMVAGLIIAISAAAVFPVFNQAGSNNKKSEFKDVCMKMVKTKLNQYKSGRSISPSMFTTATGANRASGQITTSQNPLLSMGTLSNYQPMGVSDGFSFAKYMYNVRGMRTNANAGGCVSDIQRVIYPAVFPPSIPANLGTEEAFGAPTTVGTENDNSPSISNLTPFPCGGAGLPSQVCPEDTLAMQQFGSGFRIFVHLQRVNVNAPSGTVPAGDCPNEGYDFWSSQGVPNSSMNLNNSARHYNFDAVGDAIKITVTAVLDPNVKNSNRDKYRNAFQLVKTDQSYTQYSCYASDVIKSNNANPIRYVIGTYTPPYDNSPSLTLAQRNQAATNLGWPTKADCENGGALEGKCGRAIMDLTGRPVFTSLWNENIKGISVAPNNRAVYLLLETGEIYRYGDESTVTQTANTTCIGASPNCIRRDGTTLTPLWVARLPGAIGMGLQYFAATSGTSFVYNPIRFWTISGNANAYKYVVSTQTNNTNIFSGAQVGVTSTPYMIDSKLDSCDLMSAITKEEGNGNTSPGNNRTGHPCQVGSTNMGATSYADGPYWASRFIDPLTQPSYAILSWFLDHNGGSAFFLNNACSNASANKNYCVSLYKWEDANQVDSVAPIAVFKRSTVAVSP